MDTPLDRTLFRFLVKPKQRDFACRVEILDLMNLMWPLHITDLALYSSQELRFTNKQFIGEKVVQAAIPQKEPSKVDKESEMCCLLRAVRNDEQTGATVSMVTIM